MSSAAIRQTASILGTSFIKDTTVVADGYVISDPSLAAAKVGTLSTRTDNDTGVLTMATGHGITTGNRLDVYWSGGSRIGMTAGTVATNSVPIDGGTGDNLPAAATAITAMVPQLETFSIPDTTDLKALAVGCAANAAAVFRDGSAAVVAIVKPTGSAGAYIWEDTNGADNPLDAEPDVAEVYLSHGDSSSARQVQVMALIS